MSAPLLNKNKLDVSQVFLAFVALVGDVEKTALALDLDPKVVARLAEEEGWHEKIRRVCLLSKSGKPGDWERAQNRALCWIQAHQVRDLLSRILHDVKEMETDALLDKTGSIDRTGESRWSSRFFSDLTAAMDKAHAMSYAALGDTCGERTTRETSETDSMNATALHAAVISALSCPTIIPPSVASELAGSAKLLVDQVKQEVCQNVPPVTESPTPSDIQCPTPSDKACPTP